MKITMNEKRTKVIEALKASDRALTLKEIGEAIGEEVKSGSTNALVTAGAIVKVGEVEVEKVVKVKVATYAIGDLSVLEAKDEK